MGHFIRATAGIAALVLLGLAWAFPLEAQDDVERYAGEFLEIPVGVRAMGMGSAYAGVADDGSAFQWNPSGVSLLESKTLSLMYSSQYGSLGTPLANFYFAGWSMPISSLGFAVNWIRFAVSDIPYYPDLTNPREYSSVEARYNQVRLATGEDTFSDTEDAFVFSVARNNKIDFDLGWSYFSIPIEIPVGVSVKWINHNLADQTATGIGIDAGTMLRINLKDFFFTDDWPMLIVGVTLKDIGGTKLTWAQTQRSQAVEQRTIIGTSIVQPLRFIDSRLTLATDLGGRYDNEIRWGFELKYRRQFAVRAGYNEYSFSAGAGVDFNFFDVDYAYLAPSSTHLGQVHRLGLSFNFDKVMQRSSE